MRVYSIDAPLPDISPAVVLGNFDGVHIAHRKLISEAKKCGFPVAVFTFSGQKAPYITSESEKLALLEKAGVDLVYLGDFDKLRTMPYDLFFNEILTRKIGASRIYCGFNYTFGYKASGGSADLERLCSIAGIECTVLPEICLDGECVSSTAVRNLLSQGEVEYAAKMLGHDYEITGVVSHGKALGRKLGFPTLNIPYENGRAPLRTGVYFTKCRIKDAVYPSVTNVGTQPTFDGTSNICETYILGSCGELYGIEAEVSFLKFRRDERKFENADALYAAVHDDIAAAKEYFKISETEVNI